MTGTEAQKLIVDATEFDADKHYIYTKPKVNPSGGKNIGILNAESKKGLYLATPLMLTWGVNSFTDESSGRTTYDMSLQFPKEEYNSPPVQKFLENMKALETKFKADAVSNCKDWMNKAKMSAEVVDALWNPMLKYRKDQETGEFDYSAPPTLRLKIPVWDGEWKVELYDMEQKQLFPNDQGLLPTDLVAKATNVATVMQCGGIWFANGKFGVTWKLVQAVVKPKQSMRGQCLINLSAEDKAALANTKNDDDEDEEAEVVAVEDSSDEEEEEAPVTPVKEEVAKVVEQAAPDAPKKKVVRRKAVAKEE
jgi:hypothetical protein